MTKEKQLRLNAEEIIYEYENGIHDCGYEQMTEEELIKYVLSQVYDIKSNGDGVILEGKGICNDLKFLGNEKIHQVILEIGRQTDVLIGQNATIKVKIEEI